MKRRTFLGVAGSALAGPWLNASTSHGFGDAAGGEVLPNGIVLPAAWPPRIEAIPESLQPPTTPPYLRSPPAVIPIDLGRQLFVDDFLIERTDLSRTYHRPTAHPGNPILRPDRDWEREGPAPMAMPFSDGVWYDPEDRRFKMWYIGGYGRNVCLALSDDGIAWRKPDLGVRPGANVVHPGPRDACSIWLDSTATDPRKRFVMARSHQDRTGAGKSVHYFGLSVHFSPDGIHWDERAFRTGGTGDRTTLFYNPFRRVWVYSIRHGWGFPRRRRYFETPTLTAEPGWREVEETRWWTAADALDRPRASTMISPELYNLDAAAYESLLIGLFTIWRGDTNNPPGRPKINEVFVGFSRDGFHWHRPDRRPFVSVSERSGDWNWGNVQSAGGGCLVVGNQLYFYHSGRAGAPGGEGRRDGNGATGLAILRRDGFASMDSSETPGSLTTRPVRFAGSQLFVNASVTGELTVEVLDRQGNPIPGFSRDRCRTVRGDRTRQPVEWRETSLASQAGREVRFRFHLRAGSLFAFWVSRHENGASGGFVAGGGPGLTDRDGNPGG